MKNNSGQKKDDEPIGHGGGSIDDLTPPTMKPPGLSSPSGVPAPSIGKTQFVPPPPSAADQNTIQQSSGPNTLPSDLDRTQIATSKPRSSKLDSSGPGFSTGGMPSAGQIATIVGEVPHQDLSNEKLLSDAPKLESNGKICPSLNGIPLLAKLGQGGMGAVYYGIHPRLRSEVAVKVLPFHLASQDPGMIQRFYREAQIAAKVRSAHLVSVIDVNEESGLYFLVMEYVAGITMGQYLKNAIQAGQVGLPELDAIDACIAACIGLDAAHQNGIVHRDLKPENIMLPYKSRVHKTFDLKSSKLMDLGLARSEEGQQSLTGIQAAMGTPGFMAPEQALDAKTADKRSDVFGMGATLYALLTGKPPFRGDAVMKVLMATMHEPHEPIGKIRPDISAALAEVIDRCLDKRQENRYADAHQLIRALKNVRKLIAPDSTFGGEESEQDDITQKMSGMLPVNGAGGTTANTRALTQPMTKLSYARAGATVQMDTAPKRSMLPLILGGAAVFAILAGVLGFIFLRGKDVPVEDPNKKIPVVKIDEQQVKFALDSQNRMMEDIRRYVRDGNFDIAESQLSVAVTSFNSFAAQEPRFKKEQDEVRAMISNARLHKAFVETVGKINAALAMETPEKILEARELHKLLNSGTSPEDSQEQTRLLTEIAGKEQLVANKKEFSKLFSEAKNPDLKTADALQKIEKAVGLFPNDMDARDLYNRLSARKKKEDSDARFNSLYAKAEQDFAKKDIEAADEAIQAALDLRNDDTKAKELADKISANFDADKRARKEAERAAAAKKKFVEAYKNAQKLFDEKNGEEALLTIERATSFVKDNKDANLLKIEIESLVSEQRAAAELKRKTEQYTQLLQKANGLLATDYGLDDAITFADQAIKLDLGDEKKTAAQGLKKKIADRRKLLQDRETAGKLVSEARQILVNQPNKYLDALKNVEESLMLVATDPIGLALKKELAAIKAGDEFFAKADFDNALKSLKDVENDLKDVSTHERELLSKRIALMNTAQESDRKVTNLLADAAKFGDAESFEEAFGKIASAENAFIQHPRIAPAKTALQQKKAALEVLVKKNLSDASGILKTGKLDDAITSVRALADAHKNSKELATALNSLTTVQSSENEIKTKLKTLDDYYASVKTRLGTTTHDPARYMAERAKMANLTNDAITALSQSDLSNAQEVVKTLTTRMNNLYTIANDEISKLERLIPKPVEPPKPVDPPKPAPSKDTGPAVRSGEKSIDD